MIWYLEDYENWSVKCDVTITNMESGLGLTI